MVHHDSMHRGMNDSMPADESDHHDSDHNDGDHDELVDVYDTFRLLEDSEVDYYPIDTEETQFITSSRQEDFSLEINETDFN